MYNTLKEDIVDAFNSCNITLLKGVVTKIIEDHCAVLKGCICWSIEDVIRQAEEIGYEITNDNAQQALEDTIRGADASIGVCWESFDFYIQEYGTPLNTEEDVVTDTYRFLEIGEVIQDGDWIQLPIVGFVQQRENDFEVHEIIGQKVDEDTFLVRRKIINGGQN